MQKPLFRHNLREAQKTKKASPTAQAETLAFTAGPHVCSLAACLKTGKHSAAELLFSYYTPNRLNS